MRGAMRLLRCVGTSLDAETQPGASPPCENGVNEAPLGKPCFQVTDDLFSINIVKAVEEPRPFRRQPNDHNFGSLLMLAVTAGV